jgi:hypothetical protein
MRTVAPTHEPPSSPCPSIPAFPTQTISTRTNHFSITLVRGSGPPTGYFTIGGTLTRLYVNGVLDASNNGGTMNIPTSSRFDIGGFVPTDDRPEAGGVAIGFAVAGDFDLHQKL